MSANEDNDVSNDMDIDSSFMAQLRSGPLFGLNFQTINVKQPMYTAHISVYGGGSCMAVAFSIW